MLVVTGHPARLHSTVWKPHAACLPVALGGRRSALASAELRLFGQLCVCCACAPCCRRRVCLNGHGSRCLCCLETSSCGAAWCACTRMPQLSCLLPPMMCVCCTAAARAAADWLVVVCRMSLPDLCIAAYADNSLGPTMAPCHAWPGQAVI